MEDIQVYFQNLLGPLQILLSRYRSGDDVVVVVVAVDDVGGCCRGARVKCRPEIRHRGDARNMFGCRNNKRARSKKKIKNKQLKCIFES